MTAQELQPGMRIDVNRRRMCTVVKTYRAGKWLMVVVRDEHGHEVELAKFPKSQMVVIAPEEP